MEAIAYRILVVEDDTSLRNLIVEAFEERGFEVSMAADGAEGLSLAVREKPDAILLDIIMPAMDGITMMQWVRKEGDWGAEVPIIFLTNLTPSDDAGKSLAKLGKKGSPKNLMYMQKSNWLLPDIIDAVLKKLRR